jgi:N-hydroxyarylamine O-acetyltransferase
MDPDAYLERIGLDPDRERPPTQPTLAALKHAHVTTVPFETLSITGDPHGEREGVGVSLIPDDLYGKIVECRRGGFCYELNGVFTWLLRKLGFDADRAAARVISDGDRTPPANHHSVLVTMDRRYVVDVGLGVPKLRRPVPLDGSVVTDTGTDWRLVESERPDADYLLQYRDGSTTEGDDGESGHNDTGGDRSSW